MGVGAIPPVLLPLLLFALMQATAATAAESWPTIALPEGIAASPVGETIVHDGIPMRVAVFVTPMSPAALGDWFRDSLGARHVENRIGETTVIGRAEGAYYQSVQLTPAGSGTRGVLAVTPLEALAVVQTRATGESLPGPDDSRTMSDTRAEDGGRISRHLVYTNRHSPELNRDRLLAWLKDRGYALERAVRPEGQAGEALFLRGPDREAIAVIARRVDETTVVLNTIRLVRREGQ